MVLRVNAITTGTTRFNICVLDMLLGVGFTDKEPDNGREMSDSSSPANAL